MRGISQLAGWMLEVDGGGGQNWPLHYTTLAATVLYCTVSTAELAAANRPQIHGYLDTQTGQVYLPG